MEEKTGEVVMNEGEDKRGNDEERNKNIKFFTARGKKSERI